MSRNQQIQNFIDALEQATGISVDADLTAESVTIEDSDGNELAISTAGGITVTDDGAFDINSLPEPVDVSGSVVTVEDDGTFAIDSLPEPLDVSDATVTVTDDGALDVNSVGGTVATEPQRGQSGAYGQQDVSTAAVEVVAASADRQSVLVQNTGPETVYVGFDASVTAANGVEIAAGGTYADETYAGALYAVTASGTTDIRFQEVTL